MTGSLEADVRDVCKADNERVSESSLLFPSPELIELLKKLPKPNTQPTDLISLSPMEIASKSEKEPISIIFSKGMSEEEMNKVREAEKMGRSQIEIFEGGEIQRQETILLRTIDGEFLDNGDAKKTFRQFLEIMTRDREDLLIIEYKNYVLGHGETKGIDDPLNTHYLSNLGLGQKKDDPTGKEDSLKTQLVAYAKDALNQVKPVFDALVEQFPHNYLQRDDTELVLMLGLLSDFLRGGIFYGFREGQSINYEPRRIAYNLIKEARNKQKK